MTPDILKNERLKEEVKLLKLDNGLKIFFMHKKEYLKKYAIFATNYGSNDNRFIPIGEEKVVEFPQGIAHFLEHKLFEEPEGNIFDEFSKLGSYVNAYTNFNQTAYLFSCTDRFYENLALLVKFVQNPYFTDENVEKEKGIIEQEIRMYEDSPNWRVFSNCLSNMYIKHPVKIDIAGTVDSIYRITKEDLYRCYNTFYHPSNMVLFMVGNIDINKALDVIIENQRKDLDSSYQEIYRDYPNEPMEINNIRVEESLSVSTPLFNIGFKDLEVDFGGDKLVKKQLETDILLEMLMGESSELYQKLYDEGLINNSFGAQYVGQKSYGHSIIAGESEDPDKVLSMILQDIVEIKKYGLKEEDFTRIKKKLIGYFMMDLNSIEHIANSFVTDYFNDFIFFNRLNILESINFKDIEKRLFQHLTKDNYTLSIITPK